MGTPPEARCETGVIWEERDGQVRGDRTCPSHMPHESLAPTFLSYQGRISAQLRSEKDLSPRPVPSTAQLQGSPASEVEISACSSLKYRCLHPSGAASLHLCGRGTSSSCVGMTHEGDDTSHQWRPEMPISLDCARDDTCGAR